MHGQGGVLKEWLPGASIVAHTEVAKNLVM